MFSRPSRPAAPQSGVTLPLTAAPQGSEVRRKHISSLMGDPAFRVTEMQKDVFEVSFSSLDAFTSPGSLLPPNLQLLLSLPPTFPDVAPLISLKASAGLSLTHPWLNSATMRIVGHPKLRDWNGPDTQTWPLGRIVAEIVRELQLNPPKASSGLNSSEWGDPRTFGRAGMPNGTAVVGTPPGQSYLRGAFPPDYPGGGSSAGASGARYGNSNVSRDNSDGYGVARFSDGGSPKRTSSWGAVGSFGGAHPPPSASPTNLGRSGSPIGRTPGLADFDVPAIDRMSDAEINELLTDNQAFQDFFLSLEQVRSMTAVSKELQQGNEQLARKTLGRETELRTLQEEVGEKINAMKVAKEELDRKESEREDVLAKFSAPAIIRQLSSLAHEAETKSETIAEDFLMGDKTTEDFLREFREARKLYHLRNAKVERARATMGGRGS